MALRTVLPWSGSADIVDRTYARAAGAASGWSTVPGCGSAAGIDQTDDRLGGADRAQQDDGAGGVVLLSSCLLYTSPSPRDS